MNAPLSLFSGFGIELELALVNRDDFSVLPVGDRVLRAAGARGSDDVIRDGTRWSNELCLHVIELKTNGPRPSLDGLAGVLSRDIAEIDQLLESTGGTLLPGGMHPFMDPLREARLWPHEYGEVYQTYDRAFGCRTHGFSNLQSVHVNLPFGSDAEFGALHAAVRLVLPLLPALAASSPFVEGHPTGILDNRLAHYRDNQRLVPSIAGKIVPERCFTRGDYERVILGRIRDDLERIDPEGVLEPEWVNSRGAIARFDRGSIEIRVLDTQECPRADVCVAAATISVVRALCEQRWVDATMQRKMHETRLLTVFLDAVRSGGDTVIVDDEYLGCFGVQRAPISLRELWAHLIESLDVRVDGDRGPLDVILRHGPLAERMLRAVGNDVSRSRLVELCASLNECLRQGRSFVP